MSPWLALGRAADATPHQVEEAALAAPGLAKRSHAGDPGHGAPTHRQACRPQSQVRDAPYSRGRQHGDPPASHRIRVNPSAVGGTVEERASGVGAEVTICGHFVRQIQPERLRKEGDGAAAEEDAFVVQHFWQERRTPVYGRFPIKGEVAGVDGKVGRGGPVHHLLALAGGLLQVPPDTDTGMAKGGHRVTLFHPHPVLLSHPGQVAPQIRDHTWVARREDDAWILRSRRPVRINPGLVAAFCHGEWPSVSEPRFPVWCSKGSEHPGAGVAVVRAAEPGWVLEALGARRIEGAGVHPGWVLAGTFLQSSRPHQEFRAQ